LYDEKPIKIKTIFAWEGPLFFIMPFPLLHQVFVLHAPTHSCLHPASLLAEQETLDINRSSWETIFLPQEMLPDYTMGASVCNYYNFSGTALEAIKANLTELLSDPARTELARLQEEEAQKEACTAWEFDTSEFWDTAVTENNWICDKHTYTPDLYTFSVIGIILGTFIFSAVADFCGRKLSFYIGCAVVILFTLCMLPTSHNFHLFAFFKVASAFGMLPLFQSPLNILCEISNISKRGFVIGISQSILGVLFSQLSKKG